jgi:hypothetical protein
MRNVKTMVLLLILGAAFGCNEPRATEETTERAEGEATGEATGTVVELCDGHTTVEVPAGQPVNTENGRRIAGDLMAQWREANPDAKWGEDEPAHAIVEPADNSNVIAEGETPTQGVGTTYGAHTAHEVALWDREVRRAVAEGDRVFHDADALGSTIAVSCDMCHPHAANTHPETYPKYQVQLGRVALLRDMINWCVQHPVRAPAMEPDDPRMRAMEAYIIAQRRGHDLDYGRR